MPSEAAVSEQRPYGLCQSNPDSPGDTCGYTYIRVSSSSRFFNLPIARVIFTHPYSTPSSSAVQQTVFRTRLLSSPRTGGLDSLDHLTNYFSTTFEPFTHALAILLQPSPPSMCYHKRVVFQCNHSSFGKMTRKCFLQLAYENGECESPCGKRDFNPIQSIKVQVLCHGCSVKVTDQIHKIATIKQKIAEAKAKLKVDVKFGNKQHAGNATESNATENEEEEEDESLSPVSLSFSEELGAGMVSSSTGSETREDEQEERGDQ